MILRRTRLLRRTFFANSKIRRVKIAKNTYSSFSQQVVLVLGEKTKHKALPYKKTFRAQTMLLFSSFRFAGRVVMLGFKYSRTTIRLRFSLSSCVLFFLLCVFQDSYFEKTNVKFVAEIHSSKKCRLFL